MVSEKKTSEATKQTETKAGSSKDELSIKKLKDAKKNAKATDENEDLVNTFRDVFVLSEYCWFI